MEWYNFIIEINVGEGCRDYFITTIFIHDGFENETKDRPRTDQEPTKIPTKIKY